MLPPPAMSGLQICSPLRPTTQAQTCQPKSLEEAVLVPVNPAFDQFATFIAIGMGPGPSGRLPRSAIFPELACVLGCHSPPGTDVVAFGDLQENLHLHIGERVVEVQRSIGSAVLYVYI